MYKKKDENYEFDRAFSKIMQTLDNIYEEYARKNNLTYMSMFILETLYDRKKCTQKEISEATMYSKQSVNMVIQSFLNKDWVFFEQAENDKRSKYVKLTPLGEQLSKHIFEPFWNSMDKAFAELNEHKREIMFEELSVLTNSFKEKVKKI